MIRFGEFAPGISPTIPGYSSVASGVIPRAGGSYRPMSQLLTLSDSVALGSAPKGSISFPKSDGVYARYIATYDKWYAVEASGTLTEVASGHNVPSGDHESFLKFGTKLLGTNITDGLRAYDVESGGSTAAVSGAPTARFIFEWAGVIVALDCDGDNRLIRNSDFNDHTNWTTGVADSQPLEDGGALIAGAAISQGSAIILQREAVRIVRLQTSGALYSMSLLQNKCGAVSAKSTVAAKGGVFFVDSDGFKFASETGVLEIGRENGVSEWFLDQVADLQQVEGAFDRFRQMVWWRYKISGDTDNVYSMMIGFHTIYKKWVTLTVNTSALMDTAVPGYTYDTLPDVPYDSAPDVPYDDRFWQGGENLFGGMDENFKFATFSGTSMAAQLETSKIVTGKSEVFNRVSLIGDAENATIQLGVSDRPSQAITFGSQVSMENSGSFPIRGRGRVSQYRCNVAAGESWTYLEGLDNLNEVTR